MNSTKIHRNITFLYSQSLSSIADCRETITAKREATREKLHKSVKPIIFLLKLDELDFSSVNVAMEELTLCRTDDIIRRSARSILFYIVAERNHIDFFLILCLFYSSLWIRILMCIHNTWNSLYFFSISLFSAWYQEPIKKDTQIHAFLVSSLLIGINILEKSCMFMVFSLKVTILGLPS